MYPVIPSLRFLTSCGLRDAFAFDGSCMSNTNGDVMGVIGFLGIMCTRWTTGKDALLAVCNRNISNGKSLARVGCLPSRCIAVCMFLLFWWNGCVSGADEILAHIDMASVFSLSSISGHPASARTNFVRACRGKRSAMRRDVFCIDSMRLIAEGHAIDRAILPYSNIGRMHAL